MSGWLLNSYHLLDLDLCAANEPPSSASWVYNIRESILAFSKMQILLEYKINVAILNIYIHRRQFLFLNLQS
jgi:hypothetical protein